MDDNLLTGLSILIKESYCLPVVIDQMRSGQRRMAKVAADVPRGLNTFGIKALRIHHETAMLLIGFRDHPLQDGVGRA